MSDGTDPRSSEADAQRYVDALRDASRPVPDGDIDWEVFHLRLAARAELPLARLRHPHVVTEAERSRPVRSLALHKSHVAPWWQHAARWSRLTVSASIAAGTVLVAIVRASPRQVPDSGAISIVAETSDAANDSRAAFESAVVGRATTWSIDSALMPSAADLLIPLGRGVTP